MCASMSCNRVRRPKPRTPTHTARPSAPSPAMGGNTTSAAPTWASSRSKTEGLQRNGLSVTTAKRTAAIVGVHNTRQGRRLDGETSRLLAIKAILGALDDAGLTLDDVDGISASPHST